MTSRGLPPVAGQQQGGWAVFGSDETNAVDLAAEMLTDSLHFEHLDDPHKQIWKFVAECMAHRRENHVPAFIDAHRREPQDDLCYLTVERLSVASEIPMGDLTLLPLSDNRVPNGLRRHIDGDVPHSVLLVPVRGTSGGQMYERARQSAEHSLRWLRVSLPPWSQVGDRQLRFRLGRYYAFSNGLAGWRQHSDAAYELELPRGAADAAELVLGFTSPSGGKGISLQVDIAVRWMEQATFAAEPLQGMLFLFFALEALLGDKSEGLKSHGLAFRQAMLGYIVTGQFTHPDKTLRLYESVRSAAVHGGHVPGVSERLVGSFRRSVESTFHEYLTFAKSRGFKKRGELLKALEVEPSRQTLENWLRDNGGVDWLHFLRDGSERDG